MDFLSRWFSTKRTNIGFEDIQFILRERNTDYILINTLSTMDQGCLIKGTVPYHTEETVINRCIDNKRANPIVLYGRHGCDESVETKYRQLQSLGFDRVFIYNGGLFEWLLLQDVYGANNFPTTTECKDLLKYRPKQTFVPKSSAIAILPGRI
jgi:hypothetical protein